ncbi:MAG: hypothetical protein HXS52_14470 [Theionarchaea archaeon]|nr:hypothetical protein [Theionarchaea archaeon]MBU7039129.1 hypothetical protein [Theionarchaea archaeon]
MREHLTRNRIYILITWVLLAGALLVPVEIMRIGAAFLLMTFFPGFLLWEYAGFEEKTPLVHVLCGVALLTVVVYYCAWIVWAPIPLGLSFGCALILLRRDTPLPRVDRKTIYLSGCVLFMLAYLYPWTDHVAFFPPGDEMKLHLLHCSTILESKSLPSSYAPLYPEIHHVTQPLGYHGMAVMVTQAARGSLIPVSTMVGIVAASLGCIAVYLLGKTLHSEKVGLAGSFSFVGLSFLFHQLALSGSYPLLLGIALQVFAVALVVRAATQTSRSQCVVAGLACAACFSVDLNAFLPLVLFLIGFLLFYRSTFYVLASFLLFSLPPLARIVLPPLKPLEVAFAQEWFQQSLNSLREPNVFLFSMGPLLLIFALLQVSTVRRLRQVISFPIAVGGLYVLCLCIPLLICTLVPVWWVFDPVLILRVVAVVLSLTTGLFLVGLQRMRKITWFFVGVVLVALVLQVADPFFILPQQRPTVDDDALAAFRWLSTNTTSEDIILNLQSSGDSSTWIPAVIGRRVVMPYHLYYKGDNAMSALNLPERFTDVTILKTLPSSEFSRDILGKYGITHVYIEGEEDIDPDLFVDSPLYTLEFHQRNTYIFSVTDEKPVQYGPRLYLGTGSIPNGVRSYFSLPAGEFTLLGIHYADTGEGNVDIEINDQYVGTIFRFNTDNHFVTFFVLPPGEDMNVSLFPYASPFYIDSLVLYSPEME